MRIIFLFLFCICYIVSFAQIITANIGDIVEIGGHKAIVFTVDENGEHGKAMYVNAFRGVVNPWCNSSKHSRRLPSLADFENGEKNTEIVLHYANNNNALRSFPVFNWCRSLGENWYIPSLKELECFINFWLGNEEVLNWDEDSEVELNSEKPFFKEINQRLLEAGGISFINGVYTSTVDEDGKVYVFNYNRRKNTWSLKRKSNTGLGQDCVGRAFINF